MGYRLSQIASALGLRLEGNADLCIKAVSEPASAGPDDLALAMKPAFAQTLPEGKARAAMLWEGADWQSFGLQAALLAPRPRYALTGLAAMMDPGQCYEHGIHPSAVIHESALIGENVSIGPFCTIGAGARIGAGTRIGPQCHIGADVTLGPEALLHPGMRLMARVTIGARFIAHPGAVVGADGFSFVTPEPSGVEVARASLGAQGTTTAHDWARIASLGAVHIGDDVEMGCNACIDRGSVRDTRIGHGVKIDNLVQIGHNVIVGDGSMICAGAAIAGSSELGRNVTVGGCAGISDNLKIGDRVILGGGTMVLSNVPAGRVMLGYPAMKMDNHVAAYKGLRRLPRLFADLAALKKAVSKLQGTG